MPDVIVTLDCDHRVEMPDGSAWYGTAISAFVSSIHSPSAWHYTMFMVESSDALVVPGLRHHYSAMVAVALAAQEHPAARSGAPRLSADSIVDSIDAQLAEAISRVRR